MGMAVGFDCAASAGVAADAGDSLSPPQANTASVMKANNMTASVMTAEEPGARIRTGNDGMAILSWCEIGWFSADVYTVAESEGS